MSSFPELAEWLRLNPWLGVAGFVSAVVGVVLAIIFYFKAKRVKLPFYAASSTNVVEGLGGKFRSLKMLYSGQQIESLTVTKMAFWNGGRDTIRSEDVANADPLSVCVDKNHKILDAKIIYVKNSTNQFSITTSDDQSHSALQFDYIDKGEGIVIQIIHTCTSKRDISMRGTIKGAGEPVHKYMFSLTKRARLRKAIIFFSGPVFVTVYALWSRPFSSGLSPSFFSLVVMSIAYVWMGFRTLKERVPKGFDVFEKEF